MAHYYFTHDSPHRVAAFAVDAAYRQADTFQGLPLVDFEHVTAQYPPDRFGMFVGIGYARMNKVRAERYRRVNALGYSCASYVSSKCTFLSEHPVGDNTLIMENNTIQPFARVGSNVIVWSGNHIGHDAIIEDHCFITSHVVVSGHVRVHQYCFLGVNATIRNGLTIAPETLIGAGAVVLNDTVERGVYLPMRARMSDKKSDDVEI